MKQNSYRAFWQSTQSLSLLRFWSYIAYDNQCYLDILIELNQRMWQSLKDLLKKTFFNQWPTVLFNAWDWNDQWHQNIDPPVQLLWLHQASNLDNDFLNTQTSAWLRSTLSNHHPTLQHHRPNKELKSLSCAKPSISFLGVIKKHHWVNCVKFKYCATQRIDSEF